MSYPSPFNFPGENYSTTPSTPLEGLEFQLPQWETVEQEQQRIQQHQHQQEQPAPLTTPQQQQQQQQRQLSRPHSQPPTPATYQTIQLDEPPLPPPPPPPPARVVPSQMHLETAAMHIHHVHGHGHHEGRSGLIGNTLDFSHLGLQVSDVLRPVSISPTSSGGGPSNLVVRQSRQRAEAHPYRRPQSAAGTGSTPMTQQVPLRQERPQGSSARRPSNMLPSSSTTNRTTSYGSSRSNATVTQHRSEPPSPDPGALEQPEKSYLIRGDVHIDPESKVFTAMLELPGVRKEEVRVSLSTCWYNGVKQVTVSGRTRDPFPASEGVLGLGTVVRERKYGRFVRTFAVSSDTKIEDVEASMDSGVLTIKIQGASNVMYPDTQEVTIQ
ncbi:hypothetical protein AX17_004921 [Amanita inopinata Kibby_2008]|nr:hypothetical protein AX17_004921 [Amanita inopinata Kibby_2008]